MNSDQIQAILEHFVAVPMRFLGVFPQDQFPELKQNTCFVINNKPSSHSGEQWLAFFIKSNVVEFFDSYANPPASYGFNVNAICVMRSPIQAYDSDTCGDHCIFYLVYRSRGWERDRIRSIYSESLGRNDLLIRSNTIKLARKLVSLSPCIPCNICQGCCVRCRQ